MKIIVKIKNLKKFTRFKKKWLENIIKKTIKNLKIKKDINTLEVSVLLVDDKEMKKMNKKYRNVNETTDVLAFPLDSFEEKKKDKMLHLLGDIVINLSCVKKQAIQYGLKFHQELANLAVHGVLHLIGYDDTNEKNANLMKKKQEQILSEIKVL